jgi:hypothetical protein
MPRHSTGVALIPAPRPELVPDQTCEVCGDGGAEETQVVCENGGTGDSTGCVYDLTQARTSTLWPHRCRFNRNPKHLEGICYRVKSPPSLSAPAASSHTSALSCRVNCKSGRPKLEREPYLILVHYFHHLADTAFSFAAGARASATCAAWTRRAAPPRPEPGTAGTARNTGCGGASSCDLRGACRASDDVSVMVPAPSFMPRNMPATSAAHFSYSADPPWCPDHAAQ